jgi:hypothetical protein
MVSKPLVFSSGLYSAIPTFFYSNLLQNIDNVSIINPRSPLTRKRFELLCDQYEQDKLPLVAHSSIDPKILDSHRLEKALLFDPAALPVLSTSGLAPITVHSRAPVNIILTKFYGSFVKDSFQPKIENANVINLDYGGHSDILDGMWPWMAEQMGIKSDTHNIEKYKNFIKIYLNEWLA